MIIKHHTAVSESMNGYTSRIKTSMVVLIACFLAVVIRLAYMQGIDCKRKLQEAIKIRTTVAKLRAKQGAIFDRNGYPLAITRSTNLLVFKPKLVESNPVNPLMERRLSDSIVQVADLIHIPRQDLELEIQEARRNYRAAKLKSLLVAISPFGAGGKPAKAVNKKTYAYMPITTDVSEPIADEIKKRCLRRKDPIVGFEIQDNPIRYYPIGDSLMQVVGYRGADGAPAIGLEKIFARSIMGTDGRAKFEKDPRSREIQGTRTETILARDGQDIYLTIDGHIQEIARIAAAEIMRKYTPLSVTIVIVDPMTGELLAMVNMPTFDPNPLGASGILPGRPKSKELVSSAEADRCVCRIYESGSTMKALTIASALDDGSIQPNSPFFCSGSYAIGPHVIHDAHQEVHGTVTALEILRHSCNIGAAQVAMRDGADRLYPALRRFGLLQRYDIGLLAEKSGSLGDPGVEDRRSRAKVARVGFGQAITTTPLHIAMAYAAIANGGMLVQPRLIKGYAGRKSKTGSSSKRALVSQAIKPQTSSIVREMLEGVVTEGTGRVAAVPGFVVAGKTGTAQKYGHEGGTVASFIGFLPASKTVKPRVVIHVVVDHPHGAQFGAEVAAPAFQKIAVQVMKYLNVPQDDPNSNQYTKATKGLLPVTH